MRDPVIHLPASKAPLSRHMLGALVFTFDMVCVVLTSVNAGVIYHLIAYKSLGAPHDFIAIGYVAATAYCVPSLWRGDYSIAKLYTDLPNFKRSFYLWNATFIFLLVLGFALKTTEVYSRGWLVTFYLLGYPTIFISRLVTQHFISFAMRKGVVQAQRMFIIGTRTDVRELFERHQPARAGQRVVGCITFEDAPGCDQNTKTLIDNAVKSARDINPDAVLIVTPWANRDFIQNCVESFSVLPASIHLAPGYILQHYQNSQLARLGDITSLQIRTRPLSTFDVVLKRGMDVILSVIALIVGLPFFIVIALLIKLDSRGPVFFRQRRYGFNQKPFQIWKFRTMTTQDDGPVVVQARPKDARVTRIGRLLRRFSIDEIPQLLNVLAGDMSLVGPRPHALAHDLEYELKIQRYASRHNVKPGITGWAQVNGLRGLTDTDEKMRQRLEYDLFYIDNWSLWFDLQILFLTVTSRTVYLNAL